MSMFRKAIFTFIFFSLVASTFYPQKKNSVEDDELSLEKIDFLIKTGDYSLALEELSVFIQLYPNKFDRAQKRISKIIKERNLFNQKAAELAEKMKLSSENKNLSESEIDELDSQKMDIIMALENLELNPSKEQIDLTNDARRTVRLSYYVNRSQILVNRGSEFIKNASLESSENYLRAYETFQESLSLKKSDSDIIYNGSEEIPVTYPDSLKLEVERTINRIRRLNASVKLEFEACQLAFDSYVKSLQSHSLSQSIPALSLVKNSFEKLSLTRNTLFAEGNTLTKLDERAIELNPELLDTSYITFSRWAVLGTKNELDSGMIGAIDSFWNTRVEAMKELVQKEISFQYALIADSVKTEQLSKENLAVFTDFANAASDFSVQGKNLQSLYAKLKGSPAKSFERYNSSMNFIANLSQKKLKTIFEIRSAMYEQDFSLQNLQVNGRDFMGFAGQCIKVADFYENQLSNIRLQKDENFLTQERKIQQEIDTNLQSEKSILAPGIELKDKSLNWKSEIALYDELTALSEEECIKKAGGTWSKLAKTLSDEADSKLASFTLLNAQAKNFLLGVEETAGDVKITKFYPSRAREICIKLNSDIEKERNVLTSYRNTLDGGSLYRTTEQVYSAGIINIERVTSALNSLIVSNNEIISEARIKTNEALTYANQARQMYDDALSLLKAEKYDEARQALSEADENYKKSLAHEENASLRSEFEAKIAATDERITTLQNEWVIKTVRSLITSAYNEYYAGNFENAKSSLEQAGDVWEKTQSQENPEINELMVFVRDALEFTGGKEIAFSDPLYKDMGSFLNNAKLHYEEGKNLYESEQLAQGKLLLEQARDEVRKVQRVFPKNIEANNLNLLISKILDPQSYEIAINQKISLAKTESSSGREVDIKNALNDLKDLQKVFPENKNVSIAVKDMEEVLDKAEKSLQVRRARERSQLLTAQAQREQNIARKVALLDEALSLDRRNTLAQRLKDQTYIANTSKTTVKNYLDDADDALYARAERYYNDGLKEQAQSVINDLFARNPQVSKVIKLKRRIENM